MPKLPGQVKKKVIGHIQQGVQIPLWRALGLRDLGRRGENGAMMFRLASGAMLQQVK